MWEEVVYFDETKRTDKDDRDSIEHCKNSNYKYFVHYTSGQINNFTLLDDLNFDNAVSIIYYVIFIKYRNRL